jgi:naphthoate synthase
MSQRQWTRIKEYSDILFDYYEGIARITINRPEVYNAFRPETNRQMIEAMDICRERQDIGVVVLTGEGDEAFCSGGRPARPGRGEATWAAERRAAAQRPRSPEDDPLELPEAGDRDGRGYAIGGGHVLHVVCDLTIAADNARFGQTGPRVGSFDGGFGARSSRGSSGRRRRARSGFSAERYDARQALRDGNRERGRAAGGARGRRRSSGAARS